MAIQAAREEWERDTQTSTTEGQFEQVYESFGDCLQIAVRPVTAIDAVTYFDNDGNEITIDEADYQLDEFTNAVRLNPGKHWPATQTRWDAVRVVFTSGLPQQSVAAYVKESLLLKIENHVDALSGTVEGERNSNAYEHMVRKNMRPTYP